MNNDWWQQPKPLIGAQIEAAQRAEQLEHEWSREADALEQARRRCLRRALRFLPIAALFLGIGFALEGLGWGTTEVLEIPLHVWLKLPGGIALVIGVISLRGYLSPSQLKPLL
jgi:hypothetical protein